MDIYSKIIQDCFWDYDMSIDDIDRLAHSSDMKEKMFLFQKIMENSRDLLRSLKIFSPSDLEELIASYHISHHKQSFLTRRKHIVEHVLLGRDTTVPELAWEH